MVRLGWRSVIVCAGGPSFSQEQALRITEALRVGEAHVIVVNDGWERVPTADVLFAHDAKWWKHVRTRDDRPYKGARNVDAVRRSGFAGEMWTSARAVAETFGLRWINTVRLPGLTRREVTLNGGGNSGYAAINLAYLLGAQEIALVGFDMKTAADGRSHWFGDHDGELNNGTPYNTWRQRFGDLANDLRHMGVDVVNCSEDTAITAFRRETLDTAIAAWRHPPAQ